MNAVCANYYVTFELFTVFSANLNASLDNIYFRDSFFGKNSVLVHQVVVQNLKQHLPVDKDGRITNTMAMSA